MGADSAGSSIEADRAEMGEERTFGFRELQVGAVFSSLSPDSTLNWNRIPVFSYMALFTG